jgi:hypothetical protein
MAFFGLSVINVFPAVASQVLHGNAQTLSLLLAAFGVGALISVMFVVPFAQVMKRPGLVVGAAVLWMGVWLGLASFTSSLSVWLLCDLMLWLSAPVVMTMAVGLLQRTAPPDMRARLVSLWLMVGFGMLPLGNLWIGFSAEVWGVRSAILLNGIVLFFGAAVMLARRAGLRAWTLSAQLAS